jgi:hypothetical protein
MLGKACTKTEKKSNTVRYWNYHDEEDVIWKNIKLDLTNGAKNTNEKVEYALMSSFHDINEEDGQYKGVFNISQDYLLVYEIKCMVLHQSVIMI